MHSGFLGGKRGMFDMEDFFSFIVYILIMFMFLIILSTPRCSLRPEQKLTSDLSQLDKLNSEQELLEMLRTQLPDDLPAAIENKKSLKVGSFSIYYRISDYNAAKNSLENNAWLYKGLMYSEFIDRLEFFAGDKELKNDIFSLVTISVFVKDSLPPHIKELDLTQRHSWTYPEVHVKYGIAGRFDYDLDSDLETLPIFPGGLNLNKVIAIIPLTDKSKSPSMATVALDVQQSVAGELTE